MNTSHSFDQVAETKVTVAFMVAVTFSFTISLPSSIV